MMLRTIFATGCLTIAAAAGPVHAQDQKRAADFTLLTTQGDSLQLSSLRGRVVLLNLWATWCAPCLKEMPDLNALHEELSADGVTVVGLAVDGQDVAVVDRFIEKLGVTYPVVYGSIEVAQSVLGTNAVPILPTTLVIDQEGYISERILGTVPINETRRSLTAMLQQ